MKKTLIILAVVIVALFGCLLVKIIWFPVNTINKSVDMGYEVVDKILDGDNAIYNYEWFKQQETDIKKCLQNEEIAKEEYETYLAMLSEDASEWSKFQSQEEASLRNSYFALQKITNRAIEDYNAKSSMVSRNIFKDNLPSNITRAFYSGQQLTK